MKYLKGQIALVHLIGWGIGLSTFLGGIFWAKIGMTDSQVDKVKQVQTETLQRTATVEEAVRGLQKTTDETRADVKELLRRVK